MAATPNKNPISASKRLEPAAEFMLAFNSHGTDKILSFMSANPVWEFATDLDPDGFMHRGPAAVRAVIESSFKNFPTSLTGRCEHTTPATALLSRSLFCRRAKT
jgi:hypothetical protein